MSINVFRKARKQACDFLAFLSTSDKKKQMKKKSTKDKKLLFEERMHTQEEAGRRTIRYNIMNTTKTEKNIPAIPFYKQILTEPAQAHIKPTEQQHRISHKHYRMTTHTAHCVGRCKVARKEKEKKEAGENLYAWRQ